MKNHEIADVIVAECKGADLNEADTRHRIIDRLIHGVLGWPVNSVYCEKHVHEGFIDYVLRDKSGNPVLLIEAKKEGSFFDLPRAVKNSSKLRHFIKLKTLASSPEIKKAVAQAAQYCPSIGCPFACVTNGHQYIIFRSFIPRQNYLDADALVISSVRFFSEAFTEAYNLLSYSAVLDDHSLQKELTSTRGRSKLLFYPKNGINRYDSPFQKNEYALYLEPIAKHYFGDLDHTNKRVMDNCYVFARDTQEVAAGMHKRLADSITPYFAADGATEISEIRSGGKLAQRIARKLADASSGEVLTLYGGKGAGKSTFIRRLFYYDPPQDFVIHAFPVVIDFLKCPQSPQEITDLMWSRLTDALNVENDLGRSNEELAKLFDDRFQIALKQGLDGWNLSSPDFIRERNKLFAEWKSDRLYVARRLRAKWQGVGKNLVVAFDNTDQLPPLLQDHCFLLAQNLAQELSCVTIISMREERYCRARTAGVLDAYLNSGYHLAAPDLVEVFTKRLRLLVKDIEERASNDRFTYLPDNVPFGDLKVFFLACLRQFMVEGNALRRFLRECSRDNTRLALEFFSQFLSSGYTHVEEIVEKPYFTVIEHQVVKPMMIPTRYNYDEEKSLIPNLFQCRTPMAGSHFTSLRLLKALKSVGSLPTERAGYRRVDVLLDDFDSLYGMRQDCEAAIDVMLKHSIIEANNRIDAYKVESVVGSGEMIYADEVRITAFGVYVLEVLSPSFTYIDLISLDCGINDESLYNEFCSMAMAERSLSINDKKRAKVDARIARVEKFIEYLKKEEENEIREMLLSDDEALMTHVFDSFQREKVRVVQSATRNYGAG